MKNPAETLSSTEPGGLENWLNLWYEEISDEGICISAEFEAKEGDVRVLTEIHAPKKGNEALELLAKTLQELANKYGLTFAHIGFPIHPGAERLFERNPNYQSFLHEDGELAWKRIFCPALQEGQKRSLNQEAD